MTNNAADRHEGGPPTKLYLLVFSAFAAPSFAAAAEADIVKTATPPSENAIALQNGAPAQLPGSCDGSPQNCFVLTAVIVDGATIYSPANLAPLYSDYLAREVSTQDLVRIADAITAKYRADGYFLTRAIVGEQSKAGGIARITVAEGRISQVTVEGSAANQVRPLLSNLDADKPLTLKELDRALALASDIPGVTIATRIEPDLDNPAAHKLVVVAKLQRYNAGFYLDNRGTDTTGPLDSYTRVAINSAIMRGDQAGLALFTIPDTPKEFALAEASYSAAMAKGARLSVAISSSKSQDGVNPATAKIGSQSSAFTLRYTYPLVAGRNKRVWADATIQASRVEQDWNISGNYQDDLRVVRTSVRGYQSTDNTMIDGSAEVSVGLGAFGASKRRPGYHSRSDADGEFTKLRVHAAVYKNLSKHYGVYASVDGQYSADPLLASEEFQVGGLPYGRAYNYGEISGDHGASGSVEFRGGYVPKVKGVNFVQGYIFYDAAQVWNYHADGFSPSIASAGVGARVTIGQRYTLRLEGAKPLTRTPFGERTKDWRPFFSVSAYY